MRAASVRWSMRMPAHWKQAPSGCRREGGRPASVVSKLTRALSGAVVQPYSSTPMMSAAEQGKRTVRHQRHEALCVGAIRCDEQKVVDQSGKKLRVSVRGQRRRAHVQNLSRTRVGRLRKRRSTRSASQHRRVDRRRTCTGAWTDSSLAGCPRSGGRACRGATRSARPQLAGRTLITCSSMTERAISRQALPVMDCGRA